MVSKAGLILRVITLWFLVLSQIFRHGMGPFKNNNAKCLILKYFCYYYRNLSNLISANCVDTTYISKGVSQKFNFGYEMKC